MSKGQGSDAAPGDDPEQEDRTPKSMDLSDLVGALGSWILGAVATLAVVWLIVFATTSGGSAGLVTLVTVAVVLVVFTLIRRIRRRSRNR